MADLFKRVPIITLYNFLLFIIDAQAQTSRKNQWIIFLCFFFLIIQPKQEKTIKPVGRKRLLNVKEY